MVNDTKRTPMKSSSVSVKSGNSRKSSLPATVSISPTNGYTSYLECPTETMSKNHEYRYA